MHVSPSETVTCPQFDLKGGCLVDMYLNVASCVTYLILIAKSLHVSHRSTQCGQALEDGEGDYLGREIKMAKSWVGARSQYGNFKCGLPANNIVYVIRNILLIDESIVLRQLRVTIIIQLMRVIPDCWSTGWPRLNPLQT